MTYLHQDEVLAKLLIDSGVFDQLVKQAQAQTLDLKGLISSLVDNLRPQFADQEPDAFVRDLVDLTAYLDFLQRNEQHANDGKALVIKNSVGSQDAFSQQMKNDQAYKILSGPNANFAVHVEGLKARLNALNDATRDNATAQPFIKHLFEQFNQQVGTITRAEDQEIPPNMLDQLDAVQKTIQKALAPLKHRKQPGIAQQVSWTPEQLAEQKAKQQQTQRAVQDIISTLPFVGNLINPSRMYQFVGHIVDFMDNHPEFDRSNQSGELETYANALLNGRAAWDKATNNKPSFVFDNNFNNVLVAFGGKMQALGALPNVLEMISNTRLVLNILLQYTPDLLSLIGAERINTQIAIADQYMSQIGSIIEQLKLHPV